MANDQQKITASGLITSPSSSIDFDETSLLEESDLSVNPDLSSSNMEALESYHNGIFASFRFRSGNRFHSFKGKLERYQIMGHRMIVNIVAPSERVLSLFKYWHSTILTVSDKSKLTYKQPRPARRQKSRSRGLTKKAEFLGDNDMFVHSYSFYRSDSKKPLTIKGTKTLNLRVLSLDVTDQLDDMSYDDDLTVNLTLSF